MILEIVTIEDNSTTIYAEVKCLRQNISKLENLYQRVYLISLTDSDYIFLRIQYLNEYFSSAISMQLEDETEKVISKVFVVSEVNKYPSP